MSKNFKYYHKRWFRVGTAVGIIFIGISTMMALAATKEETKKREAKVTIRQVEVSKLNFGEHTLSVHGNGTIESQNQLDLVSFVGGQVVYARENLKSGQFVEGGDSLLVIDNREAKNRLHQARSGLINSIVALIPQLKSTGDNSTYIKWSNYLATLDMGKTPDLPEILDSQERIRVSMHNVFNQFSTVKNAEINLERHTVKAPFDGYLIADGAMEGEWISPGQRVVSIVDPYNLEIAVPLTITELDHLSSTINATALVRPTEDHSKGVAGVMKRQNVHIDPNSQTVRVHVELFNKDLDVAFLPGNYMDVYIDGKTLHDVDLLPRDVIAPGSFVYTLEDSVLAKVPVSVIASQGDSVVIKSNPLKSGDLVVTTLLQRPIVGMRIATQDMLEVSDSAQAAL
jgi:multidrug efflux pump subunit AcrA (membrane-fusion protein)